MWLECFSGLISQIYHVEVKLNVIFITVKYLKSIGRVDQFNQNWSIQWKMIDSMKMTKSFVWLSRFCWKSWLSRFYRKVDLVDFAERLINSMKSENWSKWKSDYVDFIFMRKNNIRMLGTNALIILNVWLHEYQFGTEQKSWNWFLELRTETLWNVIFW